MTTRRALLAAPALLPAMPARAQQRPLRIITPFAPGGTTDSLARIIGQRITALTGQAAVVEPKPGAGGDLAMQAGASAEPDGHTLILGSDSSLVRNPMLRRNIPYDPERDFAPIARLVISWYAIAVHASVPARTVAEFFDWARANPGSVNYGSAGPGTLAHVIGEMMSQGRQLQMQHIPYRGAAPALQELVAGRLQFYAVSAAGLLPLLREGSVRVLAVTGPARQPSLPDVPTMIEAGFAEYDHSAFYSLSGPARMPSALVDRTGALLGRIMAEPETVERLRELAFDPAFLGPEAFRAFLAADRIRWREIIARTGLTLES
ncbi:tripartite tricarboxylate transporter substrate binding protein [Roseomonas terrae]|jgi:tripartite-type tricarboxylate transporter receptor subunit TctC|uniref:Tripartite tricarboxylate transporter substrate binding protein n=1 Tax=Neoroseomonas terrae TaxID=424799 RepID=A0ABS5ENL4_9PROT|nr:tripartite tricarboxylate transporter substrate binding protein [Neoroseomonas terrae]MBR0652619.1 tripartite tricarboxylate transporter substrate binding protein [Neoroseomonas terrae]